MNENDLIIGNSKFNTMKEINLIIRNSK